MGEINLYQYPISPFSEKVRRVLTYKHLKWHPIDCHYEDKTNLLAVTKGAWTRVPVLEWDGEVVYNSADIIKWLDRKVPSQSRHPRRRARAHRDNRQLGRQHTSSCRCLMLTIPDLLDAVGDAQLKANREKLIGMTTAQMRERQAARTRTADGISADDRRPARGQGFFSGQELHDGGCVALPSAVFPGAQPVELFDGGGFQQSLLDGTKGFAISVH